MATIRDVATAAGVSPMTVSNVINNHPHVKATTREKVVRAMDELDYRINVAARNLRAGRTYTIGLAVAEIDRPYWGQLAARIIAEARVHGLSVAIEQTGARRESEIDALRASRNRMYDGLILSTVGLGAADVDKLRVDYPVVILGERIFDGPVDHVAMANVDGGALATRHLLEQGCRRIAILDERTDGEPSAASLRYRGYADALAAAGTEADPALFLPVTAFTLAAGRDAVSRALAQGADFDGLFCVTDTLALGALRGLADAEVAVPDRVKVIGFDDLEESGFSVPSLSTIDPDHAAMARAAVELLVSRIDAGRAGGAAPVEFVSTVHVVERESSRAAPPARP
ncbi:MULTISPECIES: LacI family DNA-binding transcriptional regulator [unclassified Rathayibacter]|uniref:LacI family DNA-binding transcriptional regulator n=1 Tax=unclassified Rathayibacter TaxID=2609250 RepID=UPI000F486089|nr:MULTISPECIES: LacI family DNA-binding transcriptional regulator [unclassified Rathayibacter]MCJ1687481.1 LacI family transcriptional regulator [Rathayibacter sp. VKM Ac-2927]ROQ05674.1 LacI family transcriptional regulator [Rathayibacter sp. PhB93]TDQ12256.1 LacI family transcriptional regulator [Rathayibacter sp. PhB1]